MADELVTMSRDTYERLMAYTEAAREWSWRFSVILDYLEPLILDALESESQKWQARQLVSAIRWIQSDE